MARRILIEHGKRARLVQSFKTSYHTVHDALCYKTNTDLAKKIRLSAVRHYGGIEVKY